MYDFIGDIHGHADELEALLEKLGYKADGRGYRHPDRKVLFVGDYIDRGPKIMRTVEIVREMTEAETALALMGNHEFNAIAFNTPVEGGGYLRPHTLKNIGQHAATLAQYRGRQERYDQDIEWFKTLPLFYETPEFRAVHASWHAPSIAHLNTAAGGNCLTEEVLMETADESSPTNDAVEKVLKGVELPLPEGRSFLDKDGTPRFHIRYKWWENPVGKNYEQLSVLSGLQLQGIPFGGTDTTHYGPDSRPIFFGHYWLKGAPSLLRGNICCLDYSVAKGGHLVAYRFDGEQELDPKKLVVA